MTTHPIFNRWLWATLLVASFLVWLGMHCAACSSGNPTQQMVRTARFAMEALCAPSMTVEECGDVMERNAAIVDSALDGGLH